jgi:pyruvate/2-oxoglutarate dehydrogenase complex dihydrolipoamide dehydrogenase (E3) component
VLQGELLSVTGHSGTNVKLRVRSGATEKDIEASHILVAAGRTPNTDRLEAARAGINLDARGYIQVDHQLRTSADGVWAMGDCAGSPQFTHVAHDDYRIVVNNLAGGERSTHGRLIPYCLFTDPELAHVGMKESEAVSKNLNYRVAKSSMAFVPRMRTISQTRGFMKALVGPDDRILGFTVLGAEASELMSVVHTAMLGDMPYTALRDAIFAHPTASEGLAVLFTRGMPIAT